MTERIAFAQMSPAGIKALRALETYVRGSGLEPSLLELIKTRVSQINNCAYCLDMHTKDALAAGETAQRLFVLSAWRETPFYSERERAALAWAEAVTLLPQSGVPDEIYAEARQQFSEQELMDLNFAVIGINAWNRIAVPFRKSVGDYQPAKVKAA